VIRRPAQHTPELHAARAPLEIGKKRGSFGDRRLVVRLDTELEENLRVLDVLLELLERVERRLEARAFARELLRFLVIVPKTGDERLLAELVDFSLQSGDVKDAPLAQQGAFGGPRW
jgi:hypothetical protein